MESSCLHHLLERFLHSREVVDGQTRKCQIRLNPGGYTLVAPRFSVREVLRGKKQCQVTGRDIAADHLGANPLLCGSRTIYSAFAQVPYR